MSSKAFLVTSVVLLAPMIAPSSGSVALPTDVVPNEIVVGFHGALPADAANLVASWGGEILYESAATNWLSARFDDEESATRAILAARARVDVRYAERDGYAYAMLEPNDPRYAEQWGYPAVRAPAAWDITLGSHDVKVSVLDTGIDVNHPDLEANLCGPFTSFVVGQGTINDENNHGTHVSGTIAATSDNAVGVAGTSRSCLMGAKVLGRGGGGQWSWIAAGIEWSADNGAHVVSMSLGGGNAPQVLRDAVQYAYLEHDVLIVAAAGNSGCQVDFVAANTGQGTVIVPARYPEVVAVAALAPPTGAGTAGFSACGESVEIAAPGQSVLSTIRNNGYAFFSGTSMATPHVSGVAALVKAQDPAISAVALRCLLDLSADDLGIPGRDGNTGWGRLNAEKALQLDQQLLATNGHAAFELACTTGAAALFE